MSEEWATIGKDLKQKDLRQTERMNLVNILPAYKSKNFQDLTDEEWVSLSWNSSKCSEGTEM